MKKSLANKLSLTFSGVVLITSIILLLISGFTFRGLSNKTESILYDNTLESYKTEVKSEVQSGITILEYFYNRYKKG